MHRSHGRMSCTNNHHPLCATKPYGSQIRHTSFLQQSGIIPLTSNCGACAGPTEGKSRPRALNTNSSSFCIWAGLVFQRASNLFFYTLFFSIIQQIVTITEHHLYTNTSFVVHFTAGLKGCTSRTSLSLHS